jgi:hypothetical protein
MSPAIAKMPLQLGNRFSKLHTQPIQKRGTKQRLIAVRLGRHARSKTDQF